jgi:hypothetical protein
VSCPFSFEGWQGGHVEEDLACLDRFAKVMGQMPAGQLLPISVLAKEMPDLQIHEPRAFFAKKEASLSYAFQLTRQLPITKMLNSNTLESLPPEVLLKGLNPTGIAYAIDVVRHFLKQPTGNPKEAWSNLPKTPINLVLGKPEVLPDESTVDAWVLEMAKLAGIGKEREATTEDLGKKPVDEKALFEQALKHDDALRDFRAFIKPELRLRPAGFTWRLFFEALLKQDVDLLASWSATAYGNSSAGYEDMGYGMISTAFRRENHAIYELRNAGDIGEGLAEHLRNKLAEWQKDLGRKS